MMPMYSKRFSFRIQWKFAMILTMIMLLTFESLPVFGEPSPDDAKTQLNEISAEEKQIVENLFVLSSEIESLNTDIEALNQSKDEIAAEIEAKNIKISIQNEIYESTKSNLAEVLRIQQRAGITSRLEALMKATSLKDFISRFNLIRDLTKNVDQLMKETEFQRIAIETERFKLEALMKDLSAKEVVLKRSLAEKSKAAQALEDYLESLESEKAYYEAYLNSIEQVWSELKPLFATTVTAFTKIIETGDLPEDTVEVVVSLFNARGIISEMKFNEILSKRQDLPELKFDFIQDGVVLTFPDYSVEIEGAFERVDHQTILYRVDGGTFYGLPMNDSALKDLFSKGDLIFSLKNILGKNGIKRIDHYEDRIELQISIGLF